MMPSNCVTVAGFFREANWQGLKIIDDDKNCLNDGVVIEELSLNPYFGLTVENFFALQNWQGIFKTPETVRMQNEELSTNQPIYALTMSVGEFFQRMVWQGQNQRITKKANIASMPKMPNVANLMPQSLNVKDLSDLL
jgi:hypothetical protein